MLNFSGFFRHFFFFDLGGEGLKGTQFIDFLRLFDFSTLLILLNFIQFSTF